jgi:bifunctional non-homologous end joining protein LigD
VDAALKKGDLKFTLDGYKLKGSWVLVRTSGRYPGARSGSGGDQRSWLLIKHKDDWAGDVDITEFAPLSVKSKGDFEDILAEDNPAVWQTNRPAKGGDTGAMLARIIERAAQLKAGRAEGADARGARAARAGQASAPAEPTAAKKRRAPRSKAPARKKTKSS